jgi:hypothetical protein
MTAIAAARTLGVLLAAAGILKLWPASPHATGSGTIDNWVVWIAVVEIVLGAGLLVRPRSRQLIIASLLLVSAFSCFHLFRILSGHSARSCGCMGPAINADHRWMAIASSVMLGFGLVALLGSTARVSTEGPNASDT